jgi:DNA polymerase-3 subunit gamma/tau
MLFWLSYVVFARKYRPKDFDEIVGQEHIATTLRNAIKQERVAHAYLFSGPRGVGKTTMARILAKALNCEKGPTPKPCNKCVSCQEISSSISMDVIEIDGASNRGIDEVRSLRENVKFAPAHGQYKLYIIDEVHMLTQEAFNALLKTLEEPPLHVKFIFATTQPNKVIATVSSRCQRFDFRKILAGDIVSKLKEIIKDESIKIDEEALYSIARQAEGSLRDAESILDQLNTFCSGEIKREDIAQILGVVSEELLERFADLIAKKDTTGALRFTNTIISEGKDVSYFLLSLIGHFRNLTVARLCAKPEGLIDLAPQSVEKLVRQAKEFSQEELFYISSVLVNTYEFVKRSPSVRVVFELAITKIANRASLASLDEIMGRIEVLQKRIESRRDDVGVTAPVNECPPERTKRPAVSYKAEGNNTPEKKEEGPKAVEPVQKPKTDEGPADDIELSHIEEIWSTFLKVIKSKKMSVASYLLEGNLSACGNGILTIGFPKNYSLHKEALERQDNKLLIEKTLGDILKKRIRVNFVTQEVDKETHAGAEKNSKEQVSRQEILKEPLIQSALEVFDGRIVKKNRDARYT